MLSRDFCYWFQGFLEIGGQEEISAEQVTLIKKHLNMVFVHEIDPSDGDEDMQKKLNKIHNGGDGRDKLFRC